MDILQDIGARLRAPSKRAPGVPLTVSGALKRLRMRLRLRAPLGRVQGAVDRWIGIDIQGRWIDIQGGWIDIQGGWIDTQGH